MLRARGAGTGDYSIAVVLPARDAAAFIERALASVISQTRPADEIIVVDDGSTDHTCDLARQCPGVRVLSVDHAGVASARNTGVAAATADFIAFLDADDYWDRGHLERISAAIEATHGAASTYFSDMQIAEHHGGGTIWGQCGLAIAGAYELHESDKRWLFADRQPMLIQASVVSRRAYVEVGGCDPSLLRRSDTHLLFRLGLHGPLCAVAGMAGRWTSENASSLTREYTPAHPVYTECTAALYSDLLDNCDVRTRDHRRVLARRAAAAHLALARRALGTSPATCLRHSWAALRRAPGTATSVTLSSLARALLGENGSAPTAVAGEAAP